MTPEIPKPGERIGRKWVVEGTLGVGGMGAVLAAVHADIGQRVAIKLLLPHLAKETAAAERLMREARAVVSLHSEHATRIYDVDRDERGVPYIVMERLEGMDFDRLLKTRGVMPVTEAVDWILEACEAVAEAHARGLVHRDLKPANLFLARRADGTMLVKVLDFGISKSLLPESDTDPTLTQTDHALGSPRYMSPEQLRSSKTVDHRSDIWSLGIILYRLVSGRSPFEADSMASYLWRVASDPPTPLSQVATAPPGFVALLDRCLQKDAALRPQSIVELATHLAPFGTAQAQESVRRVAMFAGATPTPAFGVAPPPPPPPSASLSVPGALPVADATASAWTPGRAKPKPSSLRGLALAGVATFLVVLVIGWLGLRRAPEPRTEVAAAPAPSAAVDPAPAATSSAAAAAPAGSAASSASATATAVVADTVELRVTAEPAGATIEIDGQRASGPVRLPRREGTVRVVVRAPGYQPQTRDLPLGADRKEHVVLKASGSAAKPSSPGPMETEL